MTNDEARMTKEARNPNDQTHLVCGTLTGVSCCRQRLTQRRKDAKARGMRVPAPSWSFASLRLCVFALIILLLRLGFPTGQSAESAAAEIQFFEKKIRPL